jgi:hypothetical protein
MCYFPVFYCIIAVCMNNGDDFKDAPPPPLISSNFITTFLTYGYDVNVLVT